MRIGILGTGDVGRAIGTGFLALGHEVKMGSREANNPKASAWAEEKGAKASAGSFAEAAEFGELLVLATLGVANESVIGMTGAERLRGKVVWDTTNPLDFSAGFPPKMATVGAPSGGEEVQLLAPGALVVKVFNTVGNGLMFKPDMAGGPPDMFIAGNDPTAKAATTELVRQFGWNVYDVGGIEQSRWLEGMCLVWVLTAAKDNAWRQAFKLLR
jgi:hypothetical protein